MNHKPFETWILDEDAPLSEAQSLELRSHLETCEECRALYGNWQSVREILTVPPLIPAPLGFSLRWQQQLAERELRYQKQQIKRILFFLMTGIVVIGAALGITVAATSNLADIMIFAIKTITDILISFAKIGLVLRPVLNDIPPFVPIGMWILLTTTLSILVLTWLAAAWQLAFRGVFNR